MVRRIALLTALLAACSTETSTETLPPLNTTGITAAATTTTSLVTNSNEMFIDQVHRGYKNPETFMTDLELLAQGQEYCTAASMGMNHSAMHMSIGEAAYTKEQEGLEHVILHQALTWLCPEQEYRVNP